MAGVEDVRSRPPESGRGRPIVWRARGYCDTRRRMAGRFAHNRPLVVLGRLLNRLATRWATPGAGRVAVCSPLVGVVAGLGAVAFLLAARPMIRHVLGGLLALPHAPDRRRGRRTRSRIPWPVVAGARWCRRSAAWSRACSSSPGPRGRGARHRRHDPGLPPGRRADPRPGPADQGGRLDHHDRHAAARPARKGRSRRSAPGSARSWPRAPRSRPASGGC